MVDFCLFSKSTIAFFQFIDDPGFMYRHKVCWVNTTFYITLCISKYRSIIGTIRMGKIYYWEIIIGKAYVIAFSKEN